MAEVLITLVIIGVIAAITIPTLMANARRQESSAKIKKFYSALSQANLRAKAMGNDWEEWAESASNDEEFDTSKESESFAKYLLPYLNYTKTATENRYFYIYLADGSYFSFHKGVGCIDFRYDVNGEKKPNLEGRDYFNFLYCTYSSSGFVKGKVIPYMPVSVKTRAEAMDKCKGRGIYCSGLLAIDNWEFKKDYPYNI